jgi:hypothetical protein
MEIYTAIISERIASNWSFPQQLAGNVEGLWTGIAVEIRQDGSIAYVRFARRSGNRFWTSRPRRRCASPIRCHPCRKAIKTTFSGSSSGLPRGDWNDGDLHHSRLQNERTARNFRILDNCVFPRRCPQHVQGSAKPLRAAPVAVPPAGTGEQAS